MLRYTTWFSRLVRHPARKRSGWILTTPEPAQVWVPRGQLLSWSGKPSAAQSRCCSRPR